jgi:hypothetical protein
LAQGTSAFPSELTCYVKEGFMDLLRLKTRLKLKQLRRAINKEVEENFGYCPSGNDRFDKLMDDMTYWSDIALKNYKDLWISHIDAL